MMKGIFALFAVFLMSATTYAATGNTTQTCNTGEHYDSALSICVSNTLACKPDLKSVGEKYWTNNSWGVCIMTGCESGYSKYGNGCYVVNQTIPGDFLLGLNKFYVAIGKLSYSDAKDIKDILSKRYSKVIASKKFQGFPDSKKESYKLFLETITSN